MAKRVSGLKAAKEKAKSMCRLLCARYGKGHWHVDKSPTDVLVETILSQNTTDLNSGRAFESLKRAYPDYEKLLKASEKDIARFIYSGGLPGIKAARIRNALAKVKNETGKPDISFLRKKSASEANGFLRSIPGVGPKTAAVVLCFGLGMPAFPIDTHVYRQLGRIGLIRKNEGMERAHGQMAGLVPDCEKCGCHVALIRNGRQVCRPRQPMCGSCPLLGICEYGKKEQKNIKRG